MNAYSKVPAVVGRLPEQVANLHPGEREVAEIVYSMRAASANEVRSRLVAELQDASVRRVLNRLVSKGVLRRAMAGRTFIYLPALTRKDSAIAALLEFAELHFEGSLQRASEEICRATARTEA